METNPRKNNCFKIPNITNKQSTTSTLKIDELFPFPKGYFGEVFLAQKEMFTETGQNTKITLIHFNSSYIL